jgi:hypothetical protein
MRIRHNVIYANHVEADSFLKSVGSLLRFEPEIIAPGHGPAFDVTRADLEAYRDRMAEQTRQWEGLLPEASDGPGREPGYGLDPRWATFYPYQMHTDADGRLATEVRLRNYGDRPVAAAVSLAVPRDWERAPAACELVLPAGGTGVARFTLGVPRDFWWPASRVAIAADVTLDGRRVGQVAEGVVDLEPYQHAGPTEPHARQPHPHTHGEDAAGEPHSHPSTGMHGANI